MTQAHVILRFLTLLAVGASYLSAQVAPGAITSYTPAAMAAGEPDGVSVLSVHESVNLFNGNLSFTVPLYRIEGRGHAGYSMVVPIGTKWNIENHPNNNTNVFLAVGNVYPYEMLWPASSGPNRYTPGRVLMRDSVDPGQPTFKCTFINTPGAGYTYFQSQTQTKIVWVEADGTEHEFLDSQNSGTPLPTQEPTYTCQTDPHQGGPHRGRIWLATDGSGSTFITDSDVYDSVTTTTKDLSDSRGVSGWLLFKDGTRFQTGTDGNVNQIVDRVGNDTTLTYYTDPTTGISYLFVTDSLGRQVQVQYANLVAAGSDTIQYAGAGGQTHTITVTYDYLANHLSPGFSGPAQISTLFPMAGTEPGLVNPLVVSAIILPDFSSYSFLYNTYAELTQATLPSGGVYQYDYPPSVPDDGCSGGACAIGYSQNDYVSGGTQEFAVTRRVLARRVYPNGLSNGLEGQQCYSAAYSVPQDASTVSVLYYGSDAQPGCAGGTLISQESHSYIGDPLLDIGPPPLWTEPATEGKETNTQWLEADGVTQRKSVARLWEVDPTFQWQNAVECQDNTTFDGTATVGTFLLYDTYFNTTDSYEYAFGSAPAIGGTCPTSVPAGWTRLKHTTYLTNGYDTVVVDPSTGPSGPESTHIRNLAQEADVYRSDGTLVAKTTYGYDQSSVTTESNPVGYSAPVHSGLGNLTSQSTYPNLGGAPLTTTYVYDNLGNVVTITDARANPGPYSTNISYTDNCSAGPGGNLYAYPTSVMNALNQTAHIQWDCYIGKQTSYQDVNGTRTNYLYNLSGVDPFDRLRQVQRAAGVSNEETHIAFSYPNLKTVVANQDQGTLGDGAIVSTALYDGLERKVDTQRQLGSCTIDVKQTYDAKGRPYTVSLPNNTCTETEHLETTLYDGANRPISVSTDDGAATTTSYSGSQTTVADAAGAARTMTGDGLGRTTSVVEDPTGKNYLTTYTYDALDDLISVTQGSLLRLFSYDAVKRLITANNPENGIICNGSYSGATCNGNYDGNGNLLSRVDAKGVTTTYTYDGLNRMLTKSYSDGVTPQVTISYDNSGGGSCPGGVTANNVGRQTGISTVALGSTPATSELTSYDALGRVCANSQSVGTGSTYPFGYQYNLAGGLTTEVYPSSRTVTTLYDQLNRPNGVSSGATTYTNNTNTNYASNDALAQLQFGTAGSPLATQTIVYDQGQNTLRQQPTSIAVTNNAGTQLSLSYAYCPSGQASCSSNNGNVQSVGIVVPSSLNLAQSFVHDKLNRLVSASETGGSGEWNQNYSYDQWGNRAVSGNYIPNPYATPTALTQYVNNRWMGSGASFDVNGNLLTLPSWGFTYDGENRMTAAAYSNQGNAINAGYVYDGAGRRVQKAVGSAVTTFVYDGQGELAAEYSTSSPTASGTQYLVADTLGSTRMVLDGTGAPQERLDYLPFGEEIPAPNGGRGSLYSTGIYPSGPDMESQKFTGKERDAETGLDYFGARYFSAAQGRFGSPDWSEKPETVPHADFNDPQTLNLYGYVRNNPLSKADPDGHCCWDEIVQVTKDTVLGGAKGVYDELSQLAATVNEPIDAALRMAGINFQFGVPPVAQPSSPGEQSAMRGIGLAAVIVPGGGELKALRLSEDVSIAVRANAIEKEASIVAKYTDNALVRSAKKAIESIEKHLDILKKASPEQVNSITEDLKKAGTRLEAIRAEQAKRLADAAK